MKTHCRRCGRPTELPWDYNGPGATTCDDCFSRAVDVLVDRIQAAPQGALDMVYTSGMMALGAPLADVIGDVVDLET